MTPISHPSAWQTLRTLARLHGKKLFWTFSLVVAENLLLVTYPLFAGFAINAITQGNVTTALIYALVYWVCGAWGRREEAWTPGHFHVFMRNWWCR